jgi:hypothetical protein
MPKILAVLAHVMLLVPFLVQLPAHAELSASASFRYRDVNKLVDSSDAGYLYGYAPSIIYENGIFHMLYCSSGTGPGDWDNIRYVKSEDGRIWSAPKIVLVATDPVGERAACDPSVVRYQAPGDSAPHYYLFYSGNAANIQTLMFVARSMNVDGPYEKWTTSGTWKIGASNPQAILRPANPKPDNTPWYGAGQQTVVVKDGRLYSWHTDDTTCTNQRCLRIFATSTDTPTEWPLPRPTNLVDVDSADVKFDPITDRFVMFSIENQPENTYLIRRWSGDGLTWDPPETLCDSSCFPRWSHNPGVSGDAAGHLIDARALVVYGGPYDREPTYNNDLNAALK